MTLSTDSASGLFQRRSLNLNPSLGRNRINRLLTLISASFSVIAILPLVLVLAYVLLQGGRLINLSLFTQLPPIPGMDGGGIGNAVIGTIIVTLIATVITLPVGIGGGVYLSEYAGTGWFGQLVSFSNLISRWITRVSKA